MSRPEEPQSLEALLAWAHDLLDDDLRAEALEAINEWDQRRKAMEEAVGAVEDDHLAKRWEDFMFAERRVEVLRAEVSRREGGSTEPTNAAREPDLRLVYETARSQLDTQLEFLDSLDTKLGLFLSVGAAIFAVAAAVVAVAHSQWSALTVVALALSVGTFGGLAFFTVTAMRLQRWGTGPKVVAIAAVLKRHGEREATRVAINTLQKLHVENIPAYNSKAGAIWPAAIALALETLAAAAALASVAGR